jgi:flagellar FliL protein
MAKEEKTGDEAATPAEVPTKKKGMMIWLIIGGVILVVLGVGGFFAWKMLKAPDSKEGSDKGGSQEAAQKPGPIVSLDPFLVNLSDGEDSHYLKVTINLEVESPEITPEIEERMPQIRDSILILLSSKTSEEVRSVDGKFRLRDEIISRVGKFVPGGKVKGAYFTEFIMQ